MSSTDSLVQRLRAPITDGDGDCDLRDEAADEIDHLRMLLWRIQPILNPGSEIAFKVEKEIGSVHTNGDMCAGRAKR